MKKEMIYHYIFNLSILALILGLASSCAVEPRRPLIPEQPKKEKKQFIPRKDLKMKCVEKLIKMDVKPLDASRICTEVYKREG